MRRVGNSVELSIADIVKVVGIVTGVRIRFSVISNVNILIKSGTISSFFSRRTSPRGVDHHRN